MKYYDDLLLLGCFSRSDVESLTENKKTADSIIREYLLKGYIERVRHDLYAVISFETKQPILSQYQIGCCIFPDACLSHHSAFEFFGYANQVFNEIYISSESRFQDFEYNGYFYHRVMVKKDPVIDLGNKIRSTSLEQTVIDSIEDFEKLTGIEEVLRCLALIPSLNEESMISILKKRNNGFLFQKCGFILETLNTELHLSEMFFKECQKNISGTNKFLMKGSKNNLLNSKWNLYVPKSMDYITNKGVDLNDI